MPITPDAALDRMRAANPHDADEFAGTANFLELDARLVGAPRRHPRRAALLAGVPVAGVPVAGVAVVAGVALIPGSTPGADSVIARAAAAMGDGQGIIAMQSTSFSVSNGRRADYGTKRVWLQEGDGPASARPNRVLVVSGDQAGQEDVSQPGPGGAVAGSTMQQYRPKDNTVVVGSGQGSSAPELFEARARLADAEHGDGGVTQAGEDTVNGHAAYVLTWTGPSHVEGHPGEQETLWVDKQSYTPLRFTTHYAGAGADGQPLDFTYTEDVSSYQTLPDTPESRALLQMSPHPGAATQKIG